MSPRQPSMPDDLKPVLRLSAHSANENGAAITTYIEECMALAREVIRDKGWAEQVQALLNGNPITYHLPVPQNELAFMATMVTTQAIHKIWSRKKIVHLVNPHMVEFLTSSVADKMPGSLFSKQPYSDPMVVFPQPVAVTTLYGTPGRLLAFHVVGQRVIERHRTLCSTHDDDRSDLLLNFTIEVDDERYGTELVSTRVRVPVGQGMFTVDDAIDGTLENYFAEEKLLAAPDQVREAMRVLVTKALGILVYTCTKQPDIVAIPPRVTRRRSGKKAKHVRPPKPARMINVGWVLGPALDAARRVHERVPASKGAPTGRRQRPHQRRAHMRLFWVGRGRQEPELKFIAPYEVSLDLLRPGARPAQIHPVSEQPRSHRRA